MIPGLSRVNFFDLKVQEHPENSRLLAGVLRWKRLESPECVKIKGKWYLKAKVLEITQRAELWKDKEGRVCATFNGVIPHIPYKYPIAIVLLDKLIFRSKRFRSGVDRLKRFKQSSPFLKDRYHLKACRNPEQHKSKDPLQPSPVPLIH